MVVSDWSILQVLEAGLRSGKFVSGRLSVNKHLAMTEAFVARGGAHEKTGSSDADILISGMSALLLSLHVSSLASFLSDFRERRSEQSRGR